MLSRNDLGLGRFKSLSHGFGLHFPTGEWMIHSTVEACEAMVAQSLLHGLSHPEATSPLDAEMQSWSKSKSWKTEMFICKVRQ